jgi:inorganic pyrophosphatase
MESLKMSFDIAFRGGCVMGFALVSLALAVLCILIIVYKSILKPDTPEDFKKLFEYIAGYGLGGSTVALFCRVGGGIYTKAADVGADLVGKNLMGFDEDSPKNPATIADNVGDNVGDIAGMGSDLFGSFAESTCASLVKKNKFRNYFLYFIFIFFLSEIVFVFLLNFPFLYFNFY